MNNYSRRGVFKLIGVGTAAALAQPVNMFANEASSKKKQHFITLSFDDGFKKSSIKTGEIYEKYNLSACINVIATAHLPDFVLPNEYHRWPVGDFGLCNELKQRGHEVMMHCYKHAHLDQLPFDDAKDLVLKCIEYFTKNLKGFEPKESIFNFPFNASTPALEEWLPTQVKAFRTGGNSINELPHKGQAKLTCSASGPDNCEAFVDAEIAKLLSLPSGWLIINTHGLDDEGWGPIRSEYLDELLKRLTTIKTVELIPAGKALAFK
jgi:peptidoglycan/xylan/chitin deacetylase (PgdA/CDA1 family)